MRNRGECSMPFSLSILAAFAVLAIVLLSLCGGPRLRLRTHSQAHGGIRVIELALILSRAAFRPPRWSSDLWRFADCTLRAFGRLLPESASAVSVEGVRSGSPLTDAVVRSEMAIVKTSST